MNIKRFAFTLAEVLIVLGIIGIVAQMTIPTLVEGVQKQVTITKLQKAYTTFYQAIRLSEQENGSANSWDYASASLNGANTLTFFNTYLAPYFKYSKIKTSASDIQIYLNDGTIARIWVDGGTQAHLYFYLNGETHTVGGKDYFIFLIGSKSAVSNNDEIRPYDSNLLTAITDRTGWINDPEHGCKKTGTNLAKAHCAGLIMYDGWQIKSDYPYFN